MLYPASALCYQAVLLLTHLVSTGLLFDWLYPTHFLVVRLCLMLPSSAAAD